MEVNENSKRKQKLAILKKETQNQKIGILAISTPQDYCIIAKIFPGELADREGTLKIGDRIISINNVLLLSENESNTVDPSDKKRDASPIVRKANDLLNSLEGEIKIVVEPGYAEMLKDKHLFDRKLSMKVQEDTFEKAFYVRALRNFDVENDTESIFYHEKCAKMQRGDLFAISNLYPTQERWWIGVKVTKNNHSNIPSIDSFACMISSEEKQNNGYIPFQFDIYKNHIISEQKHKLNKRRFLICRKKSREEIILNSTRKKRASLFSDWYEEMVLSTGFKYKSIVLLGPTNVNFNVIIGSICSRLVLTHCTVPKTTTNTKLTCNSKYRIIKENEFLNQIKSKAFIEWNVDSNSYYGIAKKSVLEDIRIRRVPILSLNAKSISTIRTWQYCPLVIYMQSSLSESKHGNNIHINEREVILNEFELNKNCQRSSSESSISSNDFDSIRHLVDLSISFTNLENAESQLMNFLQKPIKTFVNKSWKDY